MKRILLIALSVLTISTSAMAQRGAPAPPAALEPGASQAEVDKVVLAAPESQRNGATVIKWNPANWTYTTLRKGTNSDRLLRQVRACRASWPFSLECTMVGNLDRAAQNLKFESEPDRAEASGCARRGRKGRHQSQARCSDRSGGTFDGR